jgi:hypothetical protein
MKQTGLFTLVLALTLGFAHSAYAEDNRLTVVVANGPFAGTYKPSPSTIICMRAKAQDVFSVAWKDFEAHGKDIAEAGVEVQHPDQPKARVANAKIAFGGNDKMTGYDFPRQAVVLEISGNGGKITFDGKSKEGIKVHIEAICTDVERL